MAQLFANNATSTLASGINNSVTSLTLATGEGARFPSPTGGDFFLATLTQAGATETSWEVVKVTARSTDTLTIVRAYEGAAATWAAGDKVEIRLTNDGLVRMRFQEDTLLAAQPAAPIVTDVQLFPWRRAIPALFMQTIGGALAKRLQPGWDSLHIGVMNPENSTTAPQKFGTQCNTPTGTLSTYTPSSTDFVSSQKGQTITSAATANVTAGWRETIVPGIWRGNAAGLGGFFYFCRLTLVTVDAGAAGKNRGFWGLSSLGTGSDMTAGEPSAAAADFIGLGFDGTDTNVQLMYKDGTTAVKVDTGQVRTTTLQMWELYMFSEPNGSKIYVYLDKIIGNTRTNVLNTSYTTNIPRNTVFMGHQEMGGAGSGPGAAMVWRFGRMMYEAF